MIILRKSGQALTLRRAVFALICFMALSGRLHAQTDEIQVYDGEIAEPGIFNLMVHNNFTPNGRTQPDYPGAIVANHSYQVTGEFAYGVTPWMEQGLYLPVSSPYSTNYGSTFDGFKIRELFAEPHAKQRRIVYAANFEFSFNHRYWEQRGVTSEVRPILGLHLRQWDIIYNPIVDTDYTGGIKGLQFNPSGRVAYNINDRWAVAAEEYDGFGTFRNISPVSQQFHEVWVTTDYSGKKLLGLSLETGAGYGLTSASDKWTLKLMLSHDLNVHPWRPFAHAVAHAPEAAN